MGKLAEFKARRLEKKVQRRLPRCRKFVAKLWDTPAKTLERYRLHVARKNFDLGGGLKAAACANEKKKGKEVEFYPSSYSLGLDLSPELVHELTHLALNPSLPPLDYAGLCLSEGLADLAAILYIDGELSLGQKIIREQHGLTNSMGLYVRQLFARSTRSPREQQLHPNGLGTPFIKTLSGWGLSPKEILSIVQDSPPSMDDMFTPASYLARNNVPLQTSPISVASINRRLRTWVSDAMDAGKRWVEQGKPQPIETPSRFKAVLQAGLMLLKYPFQAVQTFYRTVMRHLRSDRSVIFTAELAPPDHCGAGMIFIDSVMHEVPEWKDALKQHPPNSMTHILDPDTYITEVRSALNLAEKPAT